MSGEERFDVALRVRLPPLESSDLVMKTLGESAQLLAGSPSLLDRVGRPHSPADLTRFESLSFNLGSAERVWRLTGPDATTQEVSHQPRLTTDDRSPCARLRWTVHVSSNSRTMYSRRMSRLENSKYCCLTGRRQGPSSTQSSRHVVGFCRQRAGSSIFTRAR